MTFADRSHAGRELAVALEFLRGRDDLLILGIPRGGVVVAAEIARALKAPLDIWLAHKIGAPGNPEFAIGSVAANGDAMFNGEIVQALGVPKSFLNEAAARERAEIERRLTRYRGGRPSPAVEGHTVVLADDGLATGSTARAALRSLRAAGPAELILAVPVAPPETVEKLKADADRIVVLATPSEFHAVGQFYAEFGQTSDEEVVRLLGDDIQ